ncbi:MAG: radical SAM protein [Candidatus Aminicenantes bacterium]|nr:radical SAM protein [Candidatus Aminicenantes bacterium]
MAENLQQIYRHREARAARLRRIANLVPLLRTIKPAAYLLVRSWEKKLRKSTAEAMAQGEKPPGAVRDRAEIGIAILRTISRAIIEDRISPQTRKKLLNILIGDAIIREGEIPIREKFRRQFGTLPPGFMLISPTKKCNLYCIGCYADSDRTEIKLSWPVLDRLVTETKELWGARFVVISGGEPLLYEDQGKDLMHLVEKHGDCFFMMYTNGTLIDDLMARRIAQAGNIMPAISVEGLKETTEKRRGRGVFDRILTAFENLRKEKVFFGISLTVTKDNAEEVFSDEVMDFYFNQQGAHFAWAFQYMPIGRAFTLDLLPTPEQRLWLYQRAWQLVYERHLFLIDFWNSGTATHGCISSGRSGGYLVVNWDGTVTPCVFVPYSPVNIYEIYSQGKNLNDVWAHPFFADLRQWQRNYGYGRDLRVEGPVRNWAMPCPMRDHFEEMYPLLQKHRPHPIDDNAAEALADPEYYKGLVDYDRKVAALLDPIWEQNYLKINPSS